MKICDKNRFCVNLPHDNRTNFSVEIEKQMQELHSRLPEKSRRLYAGVEALKFSYGGISYARLFGCSRDTVSLGI